MHDTRSYLLITLGYFVTDTKKNANMRYEIIRYATLQRIGNCLVLVYVFKIEQTKPYAKRISCGVFARVRHMTFVNGRNDTKSCWETMNFAREVLSGICLAE